MYERFTDRARKVMQLANQEAQRFNHEYIGTEHIALGLLKMDGGNGLRLLASVGAKKEAVFLAIEALLTRGPDMVTMGKMPQTPNAKKVIAMAIEEANGFEHNYVGTEHILLGLVRVPEGIGGQELIRAGLTIDAGREALKKLFSHDSESATFRAIAEILSKPKHTVRLVTCHQVQDGPNSSRPVHGSIEVQSEELWNLLREKGGYVIGAHVV